MAKGDRAALTRVISHRDDAEQLAYADSESAAFQRTLDAREALAAMQKLAPSKVREVSLPLCAPSSGSTSTRRIRRGSAPR